MLHVALIPTRPRRPASHHDVIVDRHAPTPAALEHVDHALEVEDAVREHLYPSGAYRSIDPIER
jgi:hypothetical protein